MTLTNDPSTLDFQQLASVMAAVQLEDDSWYQLHLQWIFSFMFQIVLNQHMNVKDKPTHTRNTNDITTSI